MLQAINPNAQVSLTGSGTEALSAGFAQAQGAEGDTPAFELQLALRGFAAAEAQQPLPQSSTPVQVTVTEADAEQWLASVLGQQAVRVEAREVAAQQEEQEPLDEQGEAIVLPEHAELVLAPPVVTPPAAGNSSPALDAELPAASRQMSSVAALQNASLSLPMEPERAASTQVLPTLDVPEATLLERLPASAAEGDKVAPATSASPQTATQPLAAERPLKLHAPQAQWGEQMLQSLREHVDLQINQRIQNATIRLDPPELGSLEIYLSHESGRLSVQLSAANADVVRLLQQTSERLRQELVGQNFVQVNVQVSADAQGGRQQGQAQHQAWLGEEPVRAAHINGADDGRHNPDSISDVLVTV